MAKRFPASRAAKPAGKPAELAQLIDDVVPEQYKGTDHFLDVVSWNIRFFNPRDSQRVRNIVNVFTALNADVVVLQEIEDGALDPVIDGLAETGAGLYKAAYGTTGGDQRVAILYDTAWIRAKDAIHELASKGEVKARGKDAFPRLPLWAYFTGLPVNNNNQAFDFQLVGLHLKSQRGDGETDVAQRRVAAEWLARWLTGTAQSVDADVLLVGDWNATPSSDAWQAFHDLEEQGEVQFRRINDDDEVSHLMYKSKKHIGSRLDLKVFTASLAPQVQALPEVVRWKNLDELLAGDPAARAIRQLLSEIRRDLSDHMPVVSRFYFVPRGQPQSSGATDRRAA